jgi:imidazole glycerol-phosphate synthase subunit HisH
MIGIIDYKAGNAPSVLNALKKINAPAKLVKSYSDLKDLKGIILPGVGAAKATMESLSNLKLDEAIREKVIHEKVPFLGICVGLQVLFDSSEEENTRCLGLINGKVKRFRGEDLRVPQIGWNRVFFRGKNPILSGLNEEEFYYFVNSFYVEPDNKRMVLGTTSYGNEFCSMIAYENIYATQFHVEKSGVKGLKLLKNFSTIAGG